MKSLVPALIFGLILGLFIGRTSAPKDPLLNLVSKFPVYEFGFPYTNSHGKPVWVTVHITDNPK